MKILLLENEVEHAEDTIKALRSFHYDVAWVKESEGAVNFTSYANIKDFKKFPIYIKEGSFEVEWTQDETKREQELKEWKSVTLGLFDVSLNQYDTKYGNGIDVALIIKQQLSIPILLLTQHALEHNLQEHINTARIPAYKVIDKQYTEEKNHLAFYNELKEYDIDNDNDNIPIPSKHIKIGVELSELSHGNYSLLDENQILYYKAYGDYVNVWYYSDDVLKEKLVTKNLKKLLELTNEMYPNIVRVDKSHAINILLVNKVEKNCISFKTQNATLTLNNSGIEMLKNYFLIV